MDSQEQELLAYALKLLKSRSFSEKELMDRLFAENSNALIVENVLLFLQKKNIMNDMRLARDIIEYRTEKKPAGREKVIQELNKKGLSINTIETALEDWNEQRESECAARALILKYGIKPQFIDLSSARKWFGYLTRLGFDENTISNAIHQYAGVDITDF